MYFAIPTCTTYFDLIAKLYILHVDLAMASKIELSNKYRKSEKKIILSLSAALIVPSYNSCIIFQNCRHVRWRVMYLKWDWNLIKSLISFVTLQKEVQYALCNLIKTHLTYFFSCTCFLRHHFSETKDDIQFNYVLLYHHLLAETLCKADNQDYVEVHTVVKKNSFPLQNAEKAMVCFVVPTVK